MSDTGPIQVQRQSSHGGGTPGVGAKINFDNESTTTSSDRSPEQERQDAELAERLSSLIEDANRRVVPLCKMIRKVC